MSEAKHDHLRRLFEIALELPAAQRTTFLDKKCAADPGLKRRLQVMLAAVDQDDTGEPANEVASASVAPMADGTASLREGPGTRIGPYKLLQQIGEGGFGVVFMAEQEQPVQRRVALKIIKLGMDTRQVVARFEQERQALAMMDHPNIARVLDAGATDTGRPYFVMELCKGAPIVEYCDKNSLTIDERLALIVQVCHAVQHAHGKGIIHRDLKPSNILVGTQDDKAQAKVIDFGIAKATLQRLTDKTLFTEHQQVIGTLQYMSPEQAEGSLDIDTRTDVYSLGVLLYELLTGSTPFHKQSLQDAMYSEVQRMIREVEPIKPSTRLEQSRDTLVSIAAHRRTEPKRLGAIVRGELDWIVMKALEKDRSRRYETANGMAMDLDRYLAGEAVVAAPPSAAYRLRKLLRRHKGGVAAVAGIAAALLIGLVGFAWQALLAQHERDDAVVARQSERQARDQADRLAASESTQRLLAESSARKAEATARFLVTMLGSANLRERGRGATVAQALDQAAATVGTAFLDEPEIEASLRRILGGTYLSLGMLDEAEPHLEAALEFDRRTHGEQSTDFVRTMDKVAAWKLQKGDAHGAAADYLHAIAIAETVEGPDAPLTLGLQMGYANSLVVIDREAEAEGLLREVLAKLTSTIGREAASTQIAVNSLAVLLHRLGRIDEAEQLYREAVETGERSLGPEHPDTLTARANLASVLRSRGEIADAERLMAATYASVKKVYGDSHPRTGTVANVLAQIYGERGRFKDAKPLYEESLAIRTRVEGDRSLDVVQLKHRLGMTLSRLGEMERAIALLREVVDLRTSLSGAEDPQTLLARLDLANTLVKAKQFEEAERMFKDLLPACPRVLGDDDPTTIIAMNSFAVMLMAQQRYADAEPYVEQALETGRRVQGEDHPNTLVTELNHVAVLRELGRLDEAAALGPDAIERFEAIFGARHPNLAIAHSSHAKTLIAIGKNDEAVVHLRAAIDIHKASGSSENPMFGGDALILGRLLVDAGNLGDGEPLLREIESAYVKARGDDNPTVANARLELGRCLWLRRQFAPAEALLLDSLSVVEQRLPVSRSDVQRAERYLADFYAAWSATEPDPDRAGKAAEWQAKAAADR